MFEDIEKIGKDNSAKQFISRLIAISIEAALIGTMIVIPLIFCGSIDMPEVLTVLAAAPQAPAAAAAPPPLGSNKTNEVSQKPIQHRTEINLEEFIVPTDIPELPPPTDDAMLSFGVADGVVGGTPGGTPGGVLGGILGGRVGGIVGGSHLGTYLPIYNNLTIPPPPPPLPTPLPPELDKTPRNPIVVGGMVREPALIRKINPKYPEAAKQAGITGSVVMMISIDEDGNVTEVKIQKGHTLLNKEAVNAIKQWKYRPTLLNGEPIPVIAKATVEFILR
jgi:periplasmic protein TonB